ELTLYTATNKKTHKVEEIKKNPFVHILIGYDGNGVGDSFLEIEGEAFIEESEEIKKQVWNSHFEKWFSGPNDPNYIILKIQPLLFRLMNNDSMEPITLEL
ncbi:MAG: pyridoxamine 5'-phosphate oxidase family protein, partial [Bacillota bacterium]|nr:pyridoxamine 5'-phosphate oxidase family protein [Bacillota bacterium]